MTPRPGRAKPGDVLQLATPSGVAYLHLIGRHAEYGDAVLVGPTFAQHPATVSEELFRNGYVAFYPATVAVARGLVSVVGYLKPPVVPRRLRRPGVRSGRRVMTWVIEDGITESFTRELTEDEGRLPIAVIWNHELLVQKVSEGWNPSQET